MVDRARAQAPSNRRRPASGAGRANAGTGRANAGGGTNGNRSGGGRNGAGSKPGPNEASGATSLRDTFDHIADAVTRTVGSPWALLTAVGLIVVWAVTGPLFGFSDSWQLVINTSTTIITFLMVFVIQTSQNRDGRAIQLKLDELIRANRDARNELIRTEKDSEDALTALEDEFQQEADLHAAGQESGGAVSPGGRARRGSR